MLDVDPYQALQGARPVDTFTVTSADFEEGGSLGRPQWSSAAGGVDRSPQLSWSGFPAAMASVMHCANDQARNWTAQNLPQGSRAGSWCVSACRSKSNAAVGLPCLVKVSAQAS